jgi:LysR family hydrogen peroxide-inducible transcriptional activator
MRPSIRQLEAVVAVAEQRHFGRAARACHVTPPALSAQISGLEEDLGVVLFERSRRGVVVTAAGEPVVRAAREALRAVDAVNGVARERSPLAGDLHLGVIPTVAPYLLPRGLGRVREARPELRIYLHEDRTAHIVDRLRRGELDVLLLALPVAGDDLEALPLLEEPFLLAAPAGHRLAHGGRRRVAERDLEGESVLLLEDGHCLRDQALSVCRLAGARESLEVRASSLGTLVQMVANGLGVTLLPESAVETEVHEREGLVLRRFRAPEPTRTVGLLWRKATPGSDAFAELGALLRPRAHRRRRAGSSRHT